MTYDLTGLTPKVTKCNWKSNSIYFISRYFKSKI